MPIPSGIQTVTVHFGGATDFGGTGLTNKLVATPSRDVIWKTGPHRLGGSAFPLDSASDANVVGSLILPLTDQDGFKDDSGADITGWYYTLVATVTRAGGQQEQVKKLFSPRVGQSTVHFDDIPFGVAQPVTTVPPAAVTPKQLADELGNYAALDSPHFTGTPLVNDAPIGSGAGAGLPSTIVNRTTAYTASAGDFVQADVSGGTFTVTLPAAPAVGALVSVKKISTGSNLLTIAPSGGGTIDGDPTATTSTPFAGAAFEHVGSNVWRIVASMTTTGPAGPAGPAGPSGPTGPAGATGATGIPGAGSIAEGRGKSATATLLSMPGITPSGGFQASTQSANRAAYFPRRVPTQITVDQIVVNVSSAVAGCNGRFAVYRATTDWQPTGAPLIDTGNVDCSTTGVKATTLTTPVVLTPGLYLAWANFSTGNPQTLGWPSWWPMIGYDASGSSISQIYAGQSFGTPPSTPLPWDSASSGSQPNEFIFFRESVA